MGTTFIDNSGNRYINSQNSLMDNSKKRILINRIIHKRGQGWGFDLVVASIIFTFAILFFYIFALNYSSGSEEALRDLEYEGQLIADSFLSEGNPNDWNETNVVKIGVLSDNKINDTKLERFYNLANTSYPQTKSLMAIYHNYYINFSNPINISGSIKPYIGNYSSNARNLIRISRLSVYKNKPTSVSINVWTIFNILQ